MVFCSVQTRDSFGFIDDPLSSARFRASDQVKGVVLYVWIDGHPVAWSALGLLHYTSNEPYRVEQRCCSTTINNRRIDWLGGKVCFSCLSLSRVASCRAKTMSARNNMPNAFHALYVKRSTSTYSLPSERLFIAAPAKTSLLAPRCRVGSVALSPASQRCRRPTWTCPADHSTFLCAESSCDKLELIVMRGDIEVFAIAAAIRMSLLDWNDI